MSNVVDGLRISGPYFWISPEDGLERNTARYEIMVNPSGESEVPLSDLRQMAVNFDIGKGQSVLDFVKPATAVLNGYLSENGYAQKNLVGWGGIFREVQTNIDRVFVPFEVKEAK